MNDYMMPISDEEFALMRDLIYTRFGINLTDQKRSLLVSRLQKFIRTSGFGTFGEYYEFLANDRTEQSLSQLADRISTNHTFFNREKDHFTFFIENALPAITAELEERRERDLRIWCAGCSTGQEAYMLLMLMHEYFGAAYRQWDAGILATDISHRALTAARAGIYPDEQLESLPEVWRGKYFRKRGDGCWEVIEELRREALFRRFNLMNDFPFRKPFHIIFCRNVMIYFDQATRDRLVSRFHRFTAPNGYLFIGHSESLGREQRLYTYLKPAVYQRKGPQ